MIDSPVGNVYNIKSYGVGSMVLGNIITSPSKLISTRPPSISSLVGRISLKPTTGKLSILLYRIGDSSPNNLSTVPSPGFAVDVVLSI